MAKIIEEGEKDCVLVQDGRCIPETEGSLICLQGDLRSKDNLADPLIGVQLVNGIKLMRNVEIFQYVETKNGDEYCYKKEWVREILISEHFHDEKFRGKNETKCHKYIPDHVFYASDMKIGDYSLNQELKDMLNCDDSLDLGAMELNLDEIRSKTYLPIVEIHDNKIYVCKRGFEKWKLGDHRISYNHMTAPKTLTLVARQKSYQLEPYYGKNIEGPPNNSSGLSNNSVELRNKEQERLDLESNLIEKKEDQAKQKKSLRETIRDFMDDSIKINWLFEGTKSIEQVFAIKMKQEQKITWLLRLAGFLCMTFGVYLFFAPLIALLNWIPILGTLVAIIFFLFSLSLGLSFSLIVISIAWFYYRPMIGGIMVTGAVALYVITVIAL